MTISRINASVVRSLSKDITEALAGIGVTSLTSFAARSPTVEQSGFWGGTKIVDDPVDTFSFLVPSDVANKVVSLLVTVGRLDLPGRGSVFAINVELPHSDNANHVNQVLVDGLDTVQLSNNATGICCIVQRGQGTRVARVALDIGAGVPSVTHGVGLGVRDKMGLLRIAIPADKELIWTAVASSDAEILFDGMIEAGQLDQPGKGFIYMYPLSTAHLNMDVTRGMLNSAASTEQIVVAIDGILGNIDWRQRDYIGDWKKNATYLSDLAHFLLICNEGTGDELVGAAMAAGAAGASIVKIKQLNLTNSTAAGRATKPIAREACHMIVARSAVSDILDALHRVGCFEEEKDGLVITSNTDKACTYLPTMTK